MTTTNNKIKDNYKLYQILYKIYNKYLTYKIDYKLYQLLLNLKLNVKKYQCIRIFVNMFILCCIGWVWARYP